MHVQCPERGNAAIIPLHLWRGKPIQGPLTGGVIHVGAVLASVSVLVPIASQVALAALLAASTTTGTLVAQEIVKPKALFWTPMLPFSTTGAGSTHSAAVSDASDSIGDNHLGQPPTVVERSCSNVSNAPGYCNIG